MNFPVVWDTLTAMWHHCNDRKNISEARQAEALDITSLYLTISLQGSEFNLFQMYLFIWNTVQC